MVELGAKSRGSVTRIAVVVDVRSRAFTADLTAVIRDLDTRGYRPRAAVPRGVRRRADPPLRGEPPRASAAARWPPGRRATPPNAALLGPLRDIAEVVIDTSELSVHELRARIEREFTTGPRRATLTIVSFGFKYGLPLDADLVVDMRFLPNPHWIPELRDHTGLEREVSDYVLSQAGAEEFLSRYVELFDLASAGYQREGKKYLTLAVGCTGGKHRSVATAEELARRLASDDLAIKVVHRDLGRE